METPIANSALSFTSPAWPMRVTGVSIFGATLFIYFVYPNVPMFFPVISFVFMLLAIFFSADTTVTADKTSRTLTIIKKRVIHSTITTHPYNDIAFLCQNITFTKGEKGEKIEQHHYSLGLNSATSTIPSYFLARVPVPLPIPTSSLASLNSTIRMSQEYSRARALADFIDVPLYVNDGTKNSFVNIAEVAPRYIEGIAKIPEIFSKAKTQNDKVAKEILGDKFPTERT